MQLLNFLPALCLIGTAFSAPADISRTQAAGPNDNSPVKRAWVDLQAAYNRLDYEFRAVRPGNGAYGRSGVPAASSNILDLYGRQRSEFTTIQPVGVVDAALLWTPARELLASIETIFKNIQNSKRSVVQSGERNNVRIMLQEQQRAFQDWSKVLIRVLPSTLGPAQQWTGQQFINRIVSEYDQIIRAYDRD